MELTVTLFWFMFLVYPNPTSAETTQPTTASTSISPSSTETTARKTTDLLPNEVNEIFLQFCASEIDSNKIDSAILQFAQLADAKTSIKNVVLFYLENYEEHFDNLLLFINQTGSLELQQIAYNTLVEAINLDQINPIDVFSFEKFIQTKFELISDDNMERQIYKELLLTLGNHIKELATDLNKILIFISNNTNPVRSLELVPTIVQGIDLTNFTDMNRLFEFFMQLPRVKRNKLLSKVLFEMRERRQYRHVFHVICQLKLLEKRSDNADCSVTTVEHELPPQVKPLVGDLSVWGIKSKNGDYLLYSYSLKEFFLASKPTRSFNQLNIDGWYLYGESYNSVSFEWEDYVFEHNREYVSVVCCLHNESVPTVRELNKYDLTQQWYFLMSDDLTHVQIKNIGTNELLIVKDTFDTNDQDSRVRLTMSSKCSDCDSSKWFLELQHTRDAYRYCKRV